MFSKNFSSRLRRSIHADVLGVQDVSGVREEHVRRGEVVRDEFKKQLNQSFEDWYEMNLFWKEKHPPFDTNKSESLSRLNSLLHDLNIMKLE